MTFIRFTVPSDAYRTETRVASGLFHATYRLACDGRFEEGERVWWENEMQWFNQFLPPARVGPHRRAVCWFRPDAGEAISRMWRIVDLVESEGVPVRVFHTRRPGVIVYADAFQIAAEPWRDTFTARRHVHRSGHSRADPRLRCGSTRRRNDVAGPASFTDPVAGAGRRHRTDTADMWPRRLRLQ